MESKAINQYELKSLDPKSQNIISHVEKGSIAEELEIEPGDSLISINGSCVVDLIDYMYLMSDDYVEVEIRKANGEDWILDIDKEPGEDLGVEFTNPIIDKAKSCNNKCIFCFIDQLPLGMRDTLYFKDDDSRLSFLQGNFVTLTNMKQDDINRMVSYRISPVNVSIHTTNPTLRISMLGNRFAGIILDRLNQLTDGGIDVNGQIVLCKGYNDGVELERTLDDLANMKNRIESLAIVPFGATKFRSGLASIQMFSKDDAMEIIDYVESKQKEYLNKFGTRFVFLSDEFYLKADRSLPSENEYEGFIQLENGVGLIKKFENEVVDALSKAVATPLVKKGVIVTGTSAGEFMEKISKMINEHFGGVNIDSISIVNKFFGDTITVSGLITGKDVMDAISGLKADVCFLPETMFRSGEDIFLDNIELDDLNKSTGKLCIKTPVDGKLFIDNILMQLT